jgi:hypothetical protein
MSRAERPPIGAVVASLDEARTVLRQALAEGATVQLSSPPDAAMIQGVLWFAELQKNLREEFPAAAFSLTLDCGDRADLAHAALSEGIRSIRLKGHPKALAAIADIAEQLGAEFVRGDSGSKN